MANRFRSGREQIFNIQGFFNVPAVPGQNLSFVSPSDRPQSGQLSVKGLSNLVTVVMMATARR